MARSLQRSSAGARAVAIVLLVTACTPGVKYGDSLASPLVSSGERRSIPPATAPPAPTLHSAPTEAAVQTQLAGLRVPFIANEGQVDGQVAYYAPTFAGTLFVTQQGELVYALNGPQTDAKRDSGRPSSTPGWSLTETLRGGRVRPVGQDRSATGVSSFLGNDPARWSSELSTWEQVSLGEVWPGVTVALRARGRSMEKVFTVHPGGVVGRIRVGVAGAQALTVDAEGALVAGTGLGAVTFTAPVAYQERDGVRRPVAVAYRPQGFEYGFSVGAYDPDLPLVIDPLLQSTYLGGSGTLDLAFALAIHPTTGDIYVAGRTGSTDFPGTAGGAQPASGGLNDAFVARLPSTLTSLTQATYLGGSFGDEATALAIHPTTGDIYVAGYTGSTDFPGTAGGAQPATGGSDPFYPNDAFVARLPSTLTSLTQATYLGGSFSDEAHALAIHPTTGDIYVAGVTPSSNFPGTAGGTQPAYGGGYDAFVARLPSTLTSLTQATYLGGSGVDEATALAIHPTTGDVYVAGFTVSSNFPGTTGGAQSAFGGGTDAFVARFPSPLTSLTQATYLGGSGVDEAFGLAIHPTTGAVYVAGFAASSNFPGTTGGAQPAFGGDEDAFVARLTFDLVLESALSVTPLSLNFGSVIANTTADLTFTVQNTGTGTLTGTAAASGAPFSVVAGSPFTLGAGASQPVTVRFSPTAGHTFSSNVNFTSDAGDLSRSVTGQGQTFTDVPGTDPFFPWIEALFAAGITGGCATSPPQYCPDAQVTRDQMAVFLLRGIHGAGYQPPAATGTMFADVPVSQPFATWIEQLAREGITGGCGATTYCPDDPVTRGQMAVFLLRAKHGAGYEPPAATGTMFADVPVSQPYAKWIEQLAREGITWGCGVTTYCPDDPVTRGEMAVFLVRAFGLPL